MSSQRESANGGKADSAENIPSASGSGQSPSLRREFGTGILWLVLYVIGIVGAIAFGLFSNFHSAFLERFFPMFGIPFS